MKFAGRFILATLVLWQAGAYAQPGQTNPVIVGTGQGTFVGNAGDYNINQVTQDNSAVLREIINRTSAIQDLDRQYLQGIAQRLNDQLQSLVRLKLAFTQLSQKAALSNVALQDYLNQVNAIKAANESLINEIQTQTLITRDSLPSYEPVQSSGATATVNTPGNINMRPLMERVESLRAAVIKDINNTTFANLLTPVGQRMSITANALSPNLAGLAILSDREIQAYEREIQLLMTLNPDTRVIQQRFVDRIVNDINAFVANYGTSETLRFRDANDQKAMNEAFRGIVDEFFRRSYLRKKYGIRMGAIQSSGYPKNIGNFEHMGVQPLRVAATSFRRREAAMTDSEIQNAFEDARNFVQLFDRRLHPAFGSRSNRAAERGEYSTDDTGILVRINSTITLVTGQRSTAEALLKVMRLVLADIREEMMLLRNDTGILASYHEARYRATQGLRTQTNTRMCQIDWTLSQAAHNANCVPLGVRAKATRVAALTGTSTAEIFSSLLGQYLNVEAARRQTATFRQSMLDAARSARGETTDSDNDLFK